MPTGWVDGIEPVFCDTNVLVYAFQAGSDPRCDVARRALRTLLLEERLCLSSQVLQEFAAVLMRKALPRVTPARTADCVRELATARLFSIDSEAILTALRLVDQYALSFWDCLIIAAAERCAATYLLTEDLQHGQEILGVRIINPFV